MTRRTRLSDVLACLHSLTFQHVKGAYLCFHRGLTCPEGRRWKINSCSHGQRLEAPLLSSCPQSITLSAPHWIILTLWGMTDSAGLLSTRVIYGWSHPPGLRSSIPARSQVHLGSVPLIRAGVALRHCSCQLCPHIPSTLRPSTLHPAVDTHGLADCFGEENVTRAASVFHLLPAPLRSFPAAEQTSAHTQTHTHTHLIYLYSLHTLSYLKSHLFYSIL